MEIVRALFSEDVTTWLDRQRRDGDELSWWGKGAEALGLTGEADPEVAIQVLRDGVGPDGERIGTFVHSVGRSDDGMTSRPLPPVAYYMEFRAHESVFALAADLAKREVVLEAHDWSTTGAVRKELEDDMGIGVVAVVATYHNDPISEVVFSFTDRYRDYRGWWWMGRDDILDKIQPTVRGALAKYQRRLGEELARRLGVEVAYEAIPDTGLPIAVVKS